MTKEKEGKISQLVFGQLPIWSIAFDESNFLPNFEIGF